MALGISIIFDGNCREAVSFYAKVFEQELPPFLTYAQAECDASNPNMQVPDRMRQRVKSTVLNIADTPIEFCDTPDAFGHACESNVQLTVLCEDPGGAKQVFNRLSDGGEVEVDFHLAEGRYYGVIKDQFHTGWIIKAKGQSLWDAPM